MEPKDKANNFLNNLTSYGLGYLPDLMADLQAQIVEAVQSTGKKGTLTLKLDFSRNGSQKTR